MTLGELLVGVYEWLESRAMPIFLVCLAVPLVGTGIAWLGRGGRTDREGRWFANLVVGFGAAVFVLQLIAIAVAHWGFERGLLEAHVLLLLGPWLALAAALLGIRLVFPLSELASARTAGDIGLFALALLAVFWLFGKFRGWGVLFLGSLGQMALIAVLILLFVRHLYRRIR